MNFQEIHGCYKTLTIADSFADIITKGEEIILAADRKWRPELSYIYFCIEGSLSILMLNGGLNIGNSTEYMPVGLMEWYCPLAKFEYTDSGPVTLQKTAYAAFGYLSIENCPRRVEALAKVLVFMSIFAIDLHNERCQVTSYQTIRPVLYRYPYRQHTHEGKNEGLALFIIRRTNLSRIHAFCVLVDLEAGGYTTMRRGKLVSIDHPLPADY